MVLEKTLESPLDCKEIKPVYPKVNQSWIFIGRIDAEAETPIRWKPDRKNGLIGKDADAGKDLRQEEKGMTEDEMVGWHHQLDGHDFEQPLGVGDGQGGLACCSPMGSESQTGLRTELILVLRLSHYHFHDLGHVLLPWTWGISSQLLQQITVTTPDIELGVSPPGHWTCSISSQLLAAPALHSCTR